MIEDARCPVEVGEPPPGYWHFHRCARPVKGDRGDGVQVCGIHLREAERDQARGIKLRPVKDWSER